MSDQPTPEQLAAAETELDGILARFAGAVLARRWMATEAARAEAEAAERKDAAA